MDERRYSLREAQQLLGISERTIHRWIKSGKLKSYKPGRDHQIPESAIRKVIEQSEVYPKVQWPLPFEDSTQRPPSEPGVPLEEDGPQVGRVIRREVTDVAGHQTIEVAAGLEGEEGLSPTVTVSVRELQVVIEAVAAKEIGIDQAMERLLAA